MRLFDATGAVVVAAWLLLTGLYVYQHEVAQPPGEGGQQGDTEVRLEEGDSWWLLRREDDYVGFVKRTRTQIPDGWLVEYEMLALVELLGQKRPLRLELEARLDPDAYLESFTGDARVQGRKMKIQGDFQDQRLAYSLDSGATAEPMQGSLALKQRPRLVSNSIHEAAMSGDLEPGETIRREFFNPTSVGMTEVEIEYLGEERVDVYSYETEGRHFRQRIAGRELDVYTDDDGELLIQELPFKTIATRVEPAFGKSKSATIREKVKEAERQAKRGGGQLNQVLNLLGWSGPSLGPGGGGSEPKPDVAAPDDTTVPDAGDAGSRQDAVIRETRPE